MNIVICTTPIRPTPTSYPPFGSMAVIQSLRAAGYKPYFYDIDGLRPSFEEVERFFGERKPDVLGISAVVSTAYGYVKKLIRAVRRASPKTRIVLGGNLAASAEILHRLAGVDICVAGEGEVVSVNVMRALEGSEAALPYEALSKVLGITYLNPDGEMVFTGYELRLPADEVFNPDFSILEEFSKIDNFITSPFERPDFSQDPRSQQPHRAGKKTATLVTAKGCVARCTFCHRWDKGYRPIPVGQIIDKVTMLMDRYNVGFITFTDENFGSDKRQTRELIAALKPLDILWQVGGVRVRSADPEILKAMRDAGCVAVYYGVETGSPKILKIMEKKATLQDNLNAAKWTKDAGLFTIFQLVVGMPGETDETIRETTEFLKRVTQDHPESPRSLISVNYIQALPGTPVYEYARMKGLIGRSLKDEEAYLLDISDIDAADDTKALHFTETDYLTVRSWRRKMVLEVMHHYYTHNKAEVPSLFQAAGKFISKKIWKSKASSEDHHAQAREKVIEDYSKGGYFNLSRDLSYDLIVAYLYPLRHLILFAWLIQDEFRHLPLGEFVRHLGEWMFNRIRPRRKSEIGPISLREFVAQNAPSPSSRTEKAMQPLREGR